MPTNLLKVIELLKIPETWENCAGEILYEILLDACRLYPQMPGICGERETLAVVTELVNHLDEVRGLLDAQFVVALTDETLSSQAKPKDVYLPLLKAATDASVLSTVALDGLMTLAPVDADRMAGGKWIVEQSRLREGEAQGRILCGLLVSGDKDAVDLVREELPALDHTARNELFKARGSVVTAQQVQFYLEWLEATDDEDEFGATAGMLAGLARNAQHGKVYDVRRQIPIVDHETREEPVEILGLWSTEEYGQVIAEHLMALAEQESCEDERVMPYVLREWSIPFPSHTDSAKEAGPDSDHEDGEENWMLELLMNSSPAALMMLQAAMDQRKTGR